MIVTHEFPPLCGGSGSSCARIAELLSARGWHLIVIVFPEREYAQPGKRAEVMCNDSGNTVTMWCRPPPHWSPEVYAAWVKEQIVRAALRYEPALIQGFYVGKLALPTLAAARQRGLPLVASFRGSDVYRDTLLVDGLQRVRTILTDAAAVTTVNAESSFILRQCFRTSRRIDVIPNSLSPSVERFITSQTPPRQTKQAHIPQRFKLLVSGANRAHKGAATVVEALPLIKKHLRHVRLTVVGCNSSEARWLSELGVSTGVSTSLCILPQFRQDKLWRLTAKASVVVIPSWYEGCPNVMLEAIRFGRPLVASNVGGMREALEHGHSARLFASFDHVSLAQEVIWLIKHPAQAAAQIRKAQQLLTTIFSPRREVHAWERVYSRTIHQNK